MNIRYRQMKAFVLAARLGSFTEASTAMSVTQPSFSIMIKELEATLGTKLFDRTTRRCALTDSGRLFFREIAGTLEHIEQTYAHMQEIVHGRRGWLRVASLPSLSFGLVGEALGECMAKTPDVQFELLEKTNQGLHDAVLQREVELGICTSERRDPKLSFEPLFSDKLVVIVPRGHELTRRPRSVGWSSLAKYPYVLMRGGTVGDKIKSSALHLSVAIEVDHAATALTMVRKGVGTTVFLSSVVPFVSMNGLVAIPLQGPQCTRTIGVVSFEGQPHGAIALRFLDTLRSKIDRSSAAKVG